MNVIKFGTQILKIPVQLLENHTMTLMGRTKRKRSASKGTARTAEASGSVAKDNQNRTLPRIRYYPPTLRALQKSVDRVFPLGRSKFLFFSEFSRYKSSILSALDRLLNSEIQPVCILLLVLKCTFYLETFQKRYTIASLLYLAQDSYKSVFSVTERNIL